MKQPLSEQFFISVPSKILRFIDNIGWGSISLMGPEESHLSCSSFPRFNSSIERFYTRVFLAQHSPSLTDHKSVLIPPLSLQVLG